MENKENKARNLFQKLCSYRLRIDRNGKTVVNWSSLFSLACLILAPHMSIAGIVLSLILGYHISLETEEVDGDLEERIRQAADTVKRTATAAARTVRDEVEKARAGHEPEKTKAAERKAEPVKEAAAPRSADAPARESAVNQDVVEELEKHADDFGASPLARGYGSAFSVMGSSVPILEVREEEGGENEAGVRHDQRNDTAGL